MAYPPASQRLTLLNQQGLTPNSRATAFLLNSRNLQLNSLSHIACRRALSLKQMPVNPLRRSTS
jgi:hypothetical protein